MSRKTIILREDQFNEICGVNTAYLDNSSDYAKDGLTTTKTGGAVSNGEGQKEYSEPMTTDDYAHELAPETLFALLFRNGGHGLWGHWGSGLRARELTEEIDSESEWEEKLFYKCLSYLKKTEFGNNTNLLGDTLYEVIDRVKNDDRFNKFDFKKQVNIVIRETMKKIDYEYYWEEYSGQPLPGLDGIFEGKKKLQESNGELEDRTWRLDLDNDGQKKTYSYTNLTTKKTELKQLLTQLVQQNAPEKQIQRVKSALAGVCRVLDRETGAIKQRKTNRKNLGFANQFQKEGGTKNSGNGKAHSKKTKDPNVGTGYITYA